jgi:asparagine synthase (glutamine-hydrolysing)
MAGDWERMVAQLDEPLADPAPLNVLYISQLAREHGIKVLLSGAGGDDLFTGYRRHIAVNYEGLWQWLPAGLRRVMERFGAGLDQSGPFRRRAARLLSGIGLEGDRRLAAYFAWTREADLLQLYTPEFRALLSGAMADEPMIRYLEKLPARTGKLDRMLALEQRFFLPDHNLVYTDKMSMAAGVEVRVPFLDLDLVDFAARVPARLKQRGVTGKWILKSAMAPYLPADVIHRPKTGFGAPMRRWIKQELRTLVGDLLCAESLRRRGLFEPAAVQQLMAANDIGRVDGAYTLLSLLNIEIWCRAFIDSDPTTA